MGRHMYWVGALVVGYFILSLLPDNRYTPIEYAFSCPLGSEWCVTRVLVTYIVALAVLIQWFSILRVNRIQDSINRTPHLRSIIIMTAIAGLIVAGFLIWRELQQDKAAAERWNASVQEKDAIKEVVQATLKKESSPLSALFYDVGLFNGTVTVLFKPAAVTLLDTVSERSQYLQSIEDAVMAIPAVQNVEWIVGREKIQK